jgi:hypothetical protein
MNLLEVEGSYYEMGFQQGVTFSSDIKNSFFRLVNSKPIKSLKPKFFPKFLFSKILKYIVYKKMGETYKNFVARIF